MDYYAKYLKYKRKYLLKKQYGGAIQYRVNSIYRLNNTDTSCIFKPVGFIKIELYDRVSITPTIDTQSHILKVLTDRLLENVYNRYRIKNPITSNIIKYTDTYLYVYMNSRSGTKDTIIVYMVCNLYDAFTYYIVDHVNNISGEYELNIKQNKNIYAIIVKIIKAMPTILNIIKSDSREEHQGGLKGAELITHATNLCQNTPQNQQYIFDRIKPIL